MSYQNMTRADYDRLVKSMGQAEVDNLVKTFNTQVDGQPVQPQVTPSPLSAMQPQPQQPVPPMQNNTGALSQSAAPQQMGGLAAEIQAHGAQVQEMYKDRFAKQRETIQTMYGGPSTSDTLFALSRALLAPRQTRGFGTTLGKISGAFGDMAQERRASEQRHAEARMNLEASVGDKMMALRGDTLDRRLRLAEMEAKQAEDARKAREPKYDINQLTGKYMQRPGTGTHLGMLTNDEYILAKGDPANRGKLFIGEDGVQREIP